MEICASWVNPCEYVRRIWSENDFSENFKWHGFRHLKINALFMSSQRPECHREYPVEVESGLLEVAKTDYALRSL
jgi:hypothetical protein